MQIIRHSQKTLMNVKKATIYDTIARVDLYPQFLPWCSNARVYNRTKDNFDGELEIDFGIYKVSYVSQVSLSENTIRSISHNNSVFQQLDSIWKLQEIGNCTEAQYEIQFQFQNLIFQQVSSLFLNEVVHKMTEAFESRALSQERQQSTKIPLNDHQRKAVERDPNLKKQLTEYIQIVQDQEKVSEFINRYLSERQ